MSRQLEPINLVAPGFRGLNLSQEASILSGQFATKAQNCVIDTAGRLAARAGYGVITTTEVTSTPDILTLHEYSDYSGNLETIVAWDGGIGNDILDPEGNDISGAVTDADGTWWFQNFHDNCLGFQDGQKPIVYTGIGTFATVTENSGTAPTSHRGIGLAAFGRIWAVDSDSQTIKYSALLDETRWATADGGGSIDMSSVWTDGTDRIVALAAYNGQLLVFGNKHIIFYYDGAGSALGLDPENIYVNDTVTGTGCVSQHTVQPIGETDLLFLSPNGVQSVSRLLNSGSSNPVRSRTKYVRNTLLADLTMLSDKDSLRSTYSPLFGFYLLTFPGSRTWCIDQRFPFQDEEGDVLNIITEWTLAPTAWLSDEDHDVYLGVPGNVAQYALGYDDDDGSSYRFIYQSPWIELGEQLADREKILKRIGAILYATNNATISFKWSTDFRDTFRSLQRTVEADTDAEYGEAEFGIDEFGGTLALRIIKVPARDTGQYYRLAVEADITGQFAVQQLELFTKIGRIA